MLRRIANSTSGLEPITRTRAGLWAWGWGGAARGHREFPAVREFESPYRRNVKPQLVRLHIPPGLSGVELLRINDQARELTPGTSVITVT
jgi:hypothetical protein